MESNEILGYIATAITTGGLTQLLNWRINRKKGREEGKGMEIENIKKVVDEVYQPLITQQNSRINELTQENAELRKQVSDLQKQIADIYKLLGMRTSKQLRNPNGQFARKTEEA